MVSNGLISASRRTLHAIVIACVMALWGVNLVDAFQGSDLQSQLILLRSTSRSRYGHQLQSPNSQPLWTGGSLQSSSISPTSVTTMRTPQQSPRQHRRPRWEGPHFSFLRRRMSMSYLSLRSKADDDTDGGPKFNRGDANEGGSDNINSNRNGNDSSQTNRRSSKSWSTARIGGRNKQRSINQRKSPMAPSESKPFPGLAGILAVMFLAVALTFGSGLFGNSGGDSGYYYYSYSSSVYETRTYNDNGQLEDTTRKEQSDVRSNLPGFTTSKSSAWQQRQRQNQVILKNEEALLQQENRFDQLLDTIIQDSIPFTIDQYMEE